jgi:DNA polymerase elongation subunit (family B)/uncharacterized phage-like protein YoqJ
MTMYYSDNIIVENKKSLSGLLGYSDVYIGRPSLLGNPFPIGNESERLEVIRKFEEYAISNQSVLDEITKLGERLKTGEKLRLICFCSPKPCHGNIIIKLVRKYLGENVVTPRETPNYKMTSFGGLFNVACATGHRPNKLGGYDAESKQILFDYAVELLSKSKPDKIISGMALGWDFAIAYAAIKLGIPLVAAVPFKDQPSKWFKDDINSYYELLDQATEVVYVDAQLGYGNYEVSIGKYHIDKLSMRNKWMVDNSDYILALWRPGEPGGTKNCVDYAKQKYSLPKEQIIYLWDNYLEYRDNIGKPFVDEVIEDKPDVMVVDVLAEIESESTASYLSRSTEDEDEVTSEIADAILGMGNDGEIVYPYQLNPDMEFSPYNAVYNDGKRINVDESYLAANLHWKPDFDYSSCEWEPRRVADYRECKRVYLDIETLGLNPSVKEARIIMIGLMIEGNYLGNSDIGKKAFDLLSKGHIIELQEDSDEAERAILTGLFRLIKALQPEAIVTHNGFDFDFPYIMKRCDLLGIEHPMTRVTDRERCITAASMYGQPIRFYPTYWTKPGRNGRIYNDGTFPQLVDTLHLAGQHDKIFANMTSYTLKYLAFYVGFRTEKRLELKGKEISIYWNSGEESKKQSIRDYLIFDLEDQRAVTNFFMVSPYYQTMYFPLPLQEIAVASPARKHNANLDNFYRKFYDRKLTLPDGSCKFYSRPIADEKVNYEGAIVNVNQGIYRNFFKVDFSGMYPSIMLRYVLMGQDKDPVGVFLNTIETLKSLRYVYKDLGGSNPHKAKTRQAYQDYPYLFADIDFDNISKEDKKIYKGVDNSLKVGINGGYGFLGVGFYNFNDISSAALVTAYGRIMLKKCIEISKEYCNIIECLAAETLVLTDNGYFPIFELEGKEVNILNGNQMWSKVKFFKTPEDYLYEVTFRRYSKTITIRCNGTHKWLVKPTQDKKDKSVERFMTTEELHERLEYESYKKYSVRKNTSFKLPNVLFGEDEYDEYLHGIVHGITYSDGYLNKENANGTFRHILQLVGNKCEIGEYIEKAFERCDFMISHKYNDDTRREDSIIHQFTSTDNLKILPDINRNKCYLLGFIRGMIAGDGSVSNKDGCFDISGLKETCEFIEKIAFLVGFETTRINKSNSKGRKTTIRGTQCISKVDTYKIFFSCNHATDEDFIRSFHRETFVRLKGGKKSVKPGWNITSIKKTNNKEELYCCTEPITHRFTLQGGIDTGNCDSDGLYLQPKQIEEIDDSLLTDKFVHPNKGYEINPILNGCVNPEYIWMKLEDSMPSGMGIDLEVNCPDGAIYAPAMKNYIFWEAPEDEPKLKGVYRKRNRSLLQKEFPIEFIRRWAFEGKTSAHKYGNEWITRISDFIVSNKNVIITETIQDIKKLKGDEKKHHKLLIESNCGEVGETISYYWGSRQHYAASGRKNGIKAFPIRRYLDGRVPNNQEFPCANEDVNKNVYIEKYVDDLETKVIPYSKDANLSDVMDLELVEKLMFTQRIPKQQFSKKTGEPQDNILVKNGMGEPGDTVSFYWASIQSYTESGKLSSKCDRFPVRVIINEDDSISINIQSIPDDIDKSLINLNFNVEWYLNDLLKIRNEILSVVDK